MSGLARKTAPVALFVYARPRHTRRTVEALAANEGAAATDLIIFSDAAKNEQTASAVREVRQYVASITGFRSVTVHEQEQNLGLAESIVTGVSAVVAAYGTVIVLEDDIVTSPYFLRYMNDALRLYAKDEQVMHIAGHMFPIDTTGLPETFFMRQSSCWGWATWARAWKHFTRDSASITERFSEAAIRRFNLDGTMDYWSQLLANQRGDLQTWAVFWYASIFMRKGLCLHPRESLVRNIGFDGSGENCGTEHKRDDHVTVLPITVQRMELQEETAAMQQLQIFLKKDPAMHSGKPVRKNITNYILTNKFSMEKNFYMSKQYIKEKMKKFFFNLKTESPCITEKQFFLQNGAKPWTRGYEQYKWETISEVISKNDFYTQIGTEKYGYRIDERIVELPWVLSKLPEKNRVILDAGSALNFQCIIEHDKIKSNRLFISTLAPEHQAFWNKGISYIYEDIRECCIKDNFFDCIACVSTIEHVGLDNTFLYTQDIAKKENNEKSYLFFLEVLRHKLKPGGSLLLTFPFGKYKNHKWFRVFDKSMVDELIMLFQPQHYTKEIFQYGNNCWYISDEEQASQATCFDIHERKEYEPDFLAFSRAIACLELVK